MLTFLILILGKLIVEIRRDNINVSTHGQKMHKLEPSYKLKQIKNKLKWLKQIKMVIVVISVVFLVHSSWWDHAILLKILAVYIFVLSGDLG